MQPPSDEEHRKQLILWLAMVFSIVMYFAITLFIPSKASGGQSGLETALLIAAIGMVAMSFFIKSRLSALAAKTGDVQRRFAAFVMALVPCESAALLGVVLWFIAGSATAYVLMAIGLGGMVLHFPRRITTL
ncbi:MAG: hypothetical protein GY953_55365 [bacterium]|nr:hypothetical protein [bacterium]